MAKITCINLHNELQNDVSKAKPPFKKNNTKNNNIVTEKEA